MSKFKIQNSKFRAGASLIEMVVYISIMTLILVAVTSMLLVTLSSQRNAKNLRELERSAVIVLDRLVREIRQADSPEPSESQFDAHPGRLTLNTTDEAGNPKTLEFFIDNNVLNLKENGVLQGPLTNPQVRVTNLIFYDLSSSTARAIRTELTLEAGAGEEIRTKSFYAAASFRGL
jgi:type II secretory pathway component PulJ